MILNHSGMQKIYKGRDRGFESRGHGFKYHQTPIDFNYVVVSEVIFEIVPSFQPSLDVKVGHLITKTSILEQ